MMDSNVIWQSQRQYHILGISQYALYLILGIFICWFCWFVLFLESLWYGLLALALSVFYYFEIYKALNFKSMFLDNNGLSIQTRLGGNVFYSYGSFTIKYSLAIGIRFFERVEIYDVNHHNKSFIFPCGYDSLGSFKANQEFKQLCTKHTQQALDSMNPQEKANLYKLYQSNIEIFFNETINHNVFAIDFSPYKKELKKYFYDELQEALQALNTKEKAMLYENYKVLFERTKSIQYNIDYFVPYRQEIESYLKDKND